MYICYENPELNRQNVDYVDCTLLLSERNDAAFLNAVHNTRNSKIVIVRTGSFSLTHEGNTFCVSVGDALLINANTTVSLSAISDDLSCSVIDAKQYSFTSNNQTKNTSITRLQAENFTCICNMIHYHQSGICAYRKAASSLLNVILYKILRDARVALEYNSACAQLPAPLKPLAVDAAEFIMANCHKNLMVNDLTAHFNVSRSYLSDQFTSHHGIPVKQYILQQKMLLAKSLMLNTDMTITQISNCVGFYNAAHFCRQFKSFSGVTPGAFIRQALKSPIQLTDPGSDILSVKVNTIAHNKFEDDFTSILHAHKDAEFLYILGGRGSLYTCGVTNSLCAGSCYLINPNISHTEYSNEKDPLEYFSIKIRNLAFAQRDNSSGILAFSPASFRPIFNESFVDIFSELKRKHIYFEPIVQNYLMMLLHIMTAQRPDVSFLTHESYVGRSKIHAIKDYFDANYSMDIRIEQIAKDFFISASCLNSQFKKMYSCAPKIYLQSKKLYEAKRMLQNTDLNITQIAILTGFSDSAYFTKLFKQRNGITPSEFRHHTK